MALPRRARRLWAYWRAEQRTLRQGLVALALSTLAGFVAGLTLAHITGTLQELPGLIVLIPAAAVGYVFSITNPVDWLLGLGFLTVAILYDYYRLNPSKVPWLRSKI